MFSGGSHPAFTVSHLIGLLQQLKIPRVETEAVRTRPRAAMLGRGGFGRVEFDRLKQNHETGSSTTQVAIKDLMSIPTTQRHEDMLDPSIGLTAAEAFVEISVMKHPNLLAHPNILRLLGTTDRYNAVLSSNLPLMSLVTEYADLGSSELLIHQEQQSIDAKLK